MFTVTPTNVYNHYKNISTIRTLKEAGTKEKYKNNVKGIITRNITISTSKSTTRTTTLLTQFTLNIYTNLPAITLNTHTHPHAYIKNIQ